jgi:hypothetical protein
VTAADVLDRAAATVPGIPECSAMIPVTFHPDDLPALMRCPEPPVAQVEGRCPHGHVREGWLCDEHAEMLALSGCRACLEDERLPHECPLTVRRVTEAGDD